jgi:superfamily I DNA/RNA helicase
MEKLLGDSHQRKCSVFAVMKNPVVSTSFQARTRESIESFVHLVERTRSALNTAAGPLALQQWASHFLDGIGYFEELKRSEKNAEAGENRLRNLKELIATLDGEETTQITPTERVETFLEEITLDTEREEQDEGPENAVTLITMHSCKGLEFPHVYVVGLEEGLLPHSRSKVEGTLDEERRLFYVALTRAMQTLTLSHCASRKKYGVPIPCHPSQFLKELPGDLVEHADEKSKKPVSSQASTQLFSTLRAVVE